MPSIRFSEDIRSLTEFRANIAAFLDQIRTTGRPLVLTQHGRSSAVVLDVEEYERLVERIEVLEDIQLAEQQLEHGEGVDHAEAVRQVKSRLAK